MRDPIVFPVSRRFKKMAAGTFKVCPLCETLLNQASEGCFVCGWAGRFLADPGLVHLKLEEIASRCPDLPSVTSS